jgi:membrane protein insertase Oxa1/YidC/SpoIIIJ
VLLAIVAGLTHRDPDSAAPEMPEHVRALMMILPAIGLTLTALHFGSAIALYWTTSNLFTAGQTLAMRWFVTPAARGSGAERLMRLARGLGDGGRGSCISRRH